MMVSIQRIFGFTYVTITRNHEWYYFSHMYADVIYEVETLGM